MDVDIESSSFFMRDDDDDDDDGLLLLLVVVCSMEMGTRVNPSAQAEPFCNGASFGKEE